MFRHLTCIKSNDGIPLFTRSFPQNKQLPFALIGTLNGIHTFSDHNGVKILSADTDEYKIIWKMYHANITLILIEPNLPYDERVYFSKLDLLFDTLTLLFGLDDLINIKNIEIFKKEVRIVYPMIDIIMDNNKFELFGDLCNGIDVLITNEGNLFKTSLESMLQIFNSSYGCLLVNGRIIVASKDWLDLKPSESYLLALLSMTLSGATSKDIPIYLPQKSPHEPLRFLTYQLSSNDITLCFICSQRPDLDEFENEIKRVWHPNYKSLINHKLFFPRNLPPSISLDNNLLAFLVKNKHTRAITSSLSPHINTSETNREEKLNILKFFYLNVSSNFYDTNASDSEKIELTKRNDAKQAYILIGDFQCFSLTNINHEFYAIFNKKIPTHAIRGISQTCLNLLTKDNLI